MCSDFVLWITTNDSEVFWSDELDQFTCFQCHVFHSLLELLLFLPCLTPSNKTAISGYSTLILVLLAFNDSHIEATLALADPHCGFWRQKLCTRLLHWYVGALRFRLHFINFVQKSRLLAMNWVGLFKCHYLWLRSLRNSNVSSSWTSWHQNFVPYSLHPASWCVCSSSSRFQFIVCSHFARLIQRYFWYLLQVTRSVCLLLKLLLLLLPHLCLLKLLLCFFLFQSIPVLLEPLLIWIVKCLTLGHEGIGPLFESSESLFIVVFDILGVVWFAHMERW